MPLPFKVHAAVVCDDVRQEQNNKHILIGVYNGSIIVAGFPAEVALAWWIQVFPTRTGKFDIEIMLESENAVIMRAGIGFQIYAVDWSVITLPRVPLQFQGNANLQLRLKLKDEKEWTDIVTIAVKQGAPSGVPPAQH